MSSIQGRWAGAGKVSGKLVSRVRKGLHGFLAVSQSTLYLINEGPSLDTDSHTFRHWTRQSVAGLDPCCVDDDREEFDSRIWWPSINVLLLSEL